MQFRFFHFMQVLILAGKSRETGVEFLEFLGDRKVTVNQLVEALKAAGLPEFCKILPQGTGNKDTCNFLTSNRHLCRRAMLSDDSSCLQK